MISIGGDYPLLPSRAGANGFVTKPVGFDGLIECARAVGVYWGLFNRPAGRGGST